MQACLQLIGWVAVSEYPPVEPMSDDAAVIRRARQKTGSGGAILAGAMLGLRDILEGPKKTEVAIVVAAPTEPVDLDEEGIRVTIGDTVVMTGKLAPLPEQVKHRRRRRRRR